MRTELWKRRGKIEIQKRIKRDIIMAGDDVRIEFRDNETRLYSMLKRATLPNAMVEKVCTINGSREMELDVTRSPREYSHLRG